MGIIGKTLVSMATTLALMLSSPVWAGEEELNEAIIDYMDFATYESGIIVPEQMSKEVFESAYLVDTRDAEQFAEGTIPGAVNIDWREIPARVDELPENRMVILFCNTGSLSAQAAFAARLMGHENVLILQTGIIGWRENADYKPET